MRCDKIIEIAILPHIRTSDHPPEYSWRTDYVF